MRRDLSAPIAPAPLPEGFALAPFSRGNVLACRRLLQRLYPEGLNDGGISEDGFWQWLTADAEFDPDLVFIAMRDGALAGFCQCWTSGFIKDVAVDPAFERRGLGGALVTLALDAFAARGLEAVELKTDLGNDKAQSLYRRLGFVVVERID